MKYLEHLFRDAGIVEVRHLPTGRSGIFDNPTSLLQEIEPLRGSGNLFCTLNRPTQQEASNQFGAKALRDADIGRIVRIPFDLDPVRPAGCPSTGSELQAAHSRAVGLSNRLRAFGWPAPLVGMSGNGYHLQYRTALPADAETREMLNLIYRGLKAEFDDDVVGFDTTVRNPARILRLYGTTNRKGENLPDRPWRETSCSVPQRWKQVHPTLVSALAESFARRLHRKPSPHHEPISLAGRRDYRFLDVVSWFQALGLYEHHIERHIHAVTCPWESEHTTSARNDTTIFEADGGWPGFHCKHSHCAGRNIRDVLTLYRNADSYCRRVA